MGEHAPRPTTMHTHSPPPPIFSKILFCPPPPCPFLNMKSWHLLNNHTPHIVEDVVAYISCGADSQFNMADCGTVRACNSDGNRELVGTFSNVNLLLVKNMVIAH